MLAQASAVQCAGLACGTRAGSVSTKRERSAIPRKSIAAVVVALVAAVLFGGGYLLPTIGSTIWDQGERTDRPVHRAESGEQFVYKWKSLGQL